MRVSEIRVNQIRVNQGLGVNELVILGSTESGIILFNVGSN